MSSDISSKGAKPFEKRPPIWRRIALDRAALKAEWHVPPGRLGDVIRQLRRRAAIAVRRANWLFAALLIVVFAGLTYFLAVPLLDRVFDGREQALREQGIALAAQESEIASKLGSIRGEISELLGTFAAQARPDVSPTVVFQHIEALDGERYLLLGDEGTLVAFDPERSQTTDLAPEGSQTVNFNHAARLSDDRIIVVGDEGSVLVYDPAALDRAIRLRLLEDAPGGEFNVVASLPGGGALIGGDGGQLLRLNESSDVLEPIVSAVSDSVIFFDIADVGRGRFVIAGDEGTLLLYDAQTNTVLRDLDQGSRISWRTVIQLTPSKILAAGLPNGAIVQIDLETQRTTWLVTADTSTVHFNDSIRLDDTTALIVGDEGAVVTYVFADEEQPITKLSFDQALGLSTVIFDRIAILSDSQILISGDEGAVVRLDGPTADGATRLFLQDSKNASLSHIHPLETGDALIAADRGRIFSFGRHALADDTRLTALAEVVEDDPRSLFQFLVDPTNGLVGRVEETERALLQLVGEESIIEIFIEDNAAAQEEKRALDRYFLDREQTSFASHMRICRGRPVSAEGSPGVDTEAAAPDAVTLACAQAWQQQIDARQENVFVMLTRQAPPGILLLFLLATLSGLYRYNLRLAGFHHSRADMLELIALGRSADAALVKSETEALTSMADAMSAERVEIGRSATPSDQAVAMATAILNRTK